MKEIHVLHISETFVTGVYTYIQSICAFTAQDDRIKTSIIYSPNREGTDELDFEKDFSENVELIPIRMQREISLKKDFKSLKQLQNAVKQIQPDIIHLHSSKAGVLGRIAAKAYPKAKVYYTPHGYAFLRNDISFIKQKFFKMVEKLIPYVYKGVTLACGDYEHELAKSFGKSILIRNGVSLREFYIDSNGKSGKLKSIVTVGRISFQKNPELFNAIALKFPNLNFIWIGDGELKQVLTASNVKVSGWLDRKAVLKLLAKQDVYIQTSLWEGLPFTIIEAMALQKPIIASNVMGNKDIVEHIKNGFLCNSLRDFEIAIKSFIDKPNLVAEFGNSSRIIAEDKFDRDKNFKELVEIYKP
ncbi:MAG: glycosyltransferase [Psychroflexus sp.]|nr:glycosyltransferase [Psychroflexus sp.]